MADREFPRYAVEAALTLRAGETSVSGRSTNLSRGGICGQVNGTLPVGTQITVELALVFDDKNVSEVLPLPARIVWSTPLDDGNQVGLAFRPLNPEQVKYLDLFLRYLTAQPSRNPGESDHADLFSQRRKR
jgi:hypothetical protein